jgi:conjugative relaxase-like TrwC/TraI family protein
MLSISPLKADRVDYYLASVGRGVDDYYTGSGEAPGHWVGSACESAGVSGRVGESEFRALLDGREPGSGRHLVPNRADRTLGFDLCFRAPKSVSLAFAFGDLFEVMPEVVRAHDAALVAALDYLERHAALGRRGRNGFEQVATSGFVGATFRHRTSRAGDPHLHSHVVVANLCQGSDSRWGALDGRLLFHHAKTAGYLYEAQLRIELTRRLGVAWGPVRNGIADIDGIPKSVLRSFSRRRAEMDAHLDSRGEHSPRAAQIAALATRQAKGHHVDRTELHAAWQKRAHEIGFDPSSISGLLNRVAPEPMRPAQRRDLLAELLGPDGLTSQTSVFDRRDVVRGL